MTGSRHPTRRKSQPVALLSASLCFGCRPCRFSPASGEKRRRASGPAVCRRECSVGYTTVVVDPTKKKSHGDVDHRSPFFFFSTRTATSSEFYNLCWHNYILVLQYIHVGMELSIGLILMMQACVIIPKFLPAMSWSFIYLENEPVPV